MMKLDYGYIATQKRNCLRKLLDWELKTWEGIENKACGRRTNEKKGQVVTCFVIDKTTVKSRRDFRKEKKGMGKQGREIFLHIKNP